MATASISIMKSGAADPRYWHCQFKRPWYAARVGGAAARLGELLCSPIVLPRSSRGGPEKGALGPLRARQEINAQFVG
jgi:hypothetical protein